ncbi:MAG: protein-arginine kinase activator protein [Planctomycetaceae bacterium]|nr:MAG: protein-arginine kinase activator protein [Planctomycetaceae bacterium]
MDSKTKKCERCHRPAVFHITDIHDGTAHTTHLCEQCAKGYLEHQTVSSSAQNADESLPDPADEIDLKMCPYCGITFKEFRAQGRFGCPHDYLSFREELLQLFENIHTATQHTGKVPQRAPRASQDEFHLARLRNDLKEAISEENYERAAKLRDEIQAFEARLKRPSSTTDISEAPLPE